MTASLSPHDDASLPAAQGTRPGVYGLELHGLEPTTLLARVGANSPRLEVSVELGRVDAGVERFEADRAEISLIDGGWVSLERSGRARFVIPSPVPADEILHPWLVPAAATFNGWLGRHVLHGGAFAHGDRAIAVLGEKEDGKSSLLTWLAGTQTVEVLADDLVVVDQGQILSGPRCIDLRPASAEALGGAGSRLVRSATRLRVDLPPCPPSATLAGMVVLAWGHGPDVVLHPLTPSQGIAALLPHALRADQGDRLLELIGLPVWVLERPRTWTSMHDVTEELLRLARP